MKSERKQLSFWPESLWQIDIADALWIFILTHSVQTAMAKITCKNLGM